MGFKAPIAGVLCGFESRSYDPFPDRQSGEMKAGGTTYTVWVAGPEGAGAPQLVKCSSDQFVELRDAGFGGYIEGIVELFGRDGGQVTAQMRELTKSERADDPPARPLTVAGA